MLHAWPGAIDQINRGGGDRLCQPGMIDVLMHAQFQHITQGGDPAQTWPACQGGNGLGHRGWIGVIGLIHQHEEAPGSKTDRAGNATSVNRAKL